MSGAIVIGAGPGIGRSVAQLFAREGLSVALVARSERTLESVAAAIVPAQGIPVVSFAADCRDEAALSAALDAAVERLGPPDVVVYNAAVIQEDSLGELSMSDHLRAWAVNVGGAITAAAHLVPVMAHQGHGSFIITGGMPEPKPEYVSLSLGKAGARTLVAVLDKQYGPRGIHVASVTVDGPVAPNTAFDPDKIAEHYWQLHNQKPEQWKREVIHNGHTSADGAHRSELREPATGAGTLG